MNYTNQRDERDELMAPLYQQRDTKYDFDDLLAQIHSLSAIKKKLILGKLNLKIFT